MNTQLISSPAIPPEAGVILSLIRVVGLANGQSLTFLSIDKSHPDFHQDRFSLGALFVDAEDLSKRPHVMDLPCGLSCPLGRVWLYNTQFWLKSYRNLNNKNTPVEISAPSKSIHYCVVEVQNM